MREFMITNEDNHFDLEVTSDELPKLQPWQEEILNKEFGDGE
jgi:hypothetical protein